MKKKKLLMIELSLLMAGAVAISSLMADTLYLKDGRAIEGTYAGGNANNVRFRTDGAIRNYPVKDIDDIHFSSSAPGLGATGQRFQVFENALLSINYPDHWQIYRAGDSVTLAPPGGRVMQGNAWALAHGVSVDIFKPQSGLFSYRQQLQAPTYGQGSLGDATEELIQQLQRSNRNMRVMRAREEIRVDGERALSTRLSNDSPLGGRETDWLVTVPHREGLLYLVFAAPEREFLNQEATFRLMIESVRINR